MQRQRRSGPGDFVTGVGLLGRGMGIVLREKRLLVIGMIPALIAFALLVGALVLLWFWVDELAALVTPFADGWDTGPRDAVRLIAGIAIFGLGVLLGLIVFTALALAIGDPFYERISRYVDDRAGGVPDEVHLPWWRALRRGLGDSVRLVGRSVIVGVPLFLAGLIPIFGQTVVPVVGALTGGWLLATELVGVPFERRGLGLEDRRAALKQRRGLTLGFGVATFFVFLIPLGAVVFMPAAVAGGTLLARRVLP